MTASFGSAWRSFWHTMTSNDRHASHDSPYRTGQHVPLNQSRHEPLTSVATSAVESRPDLTSYEDEHSKRSFSSNGWPGSDGITSPGGSRPYSPGMRSLSSQQRRSNDQGRGDGPEIQMQSFHDGAPPPPPVSHSWRKIDRWVEDNYEELFDQLCEGCTQNDVNELEHDLDCSLPLEVRESLQVHDGQERGGNPTGIIFGCMLLDCEEIVQEWKNWRVVNEQFLSNVSTSQPQPPLKSSSASSSSSTAPQSSSNPLWRQELLDRQDSQPPKAIQKAYAHPSWIPLARDWGGNNIAVDLAPGPAGKWGQVIIFGRDYDCKYVIARSWAAFLAVVADDINSRKVFVEEETGELKLKEFKTASVEPAYLDILRWRSDQKYGRKPPRRKPANGLGLNTNNGGKTTRESPYGSPTTSFEERGRSPQRFSTRGPNASPKTPFGVSSPLARVTEETANTAPSTSSDDKARNLPTIDVPTPSKSDDLVDMSTPIQPTKKEEPALKPESDAESAKGEDQDKDADKDKETNKHSKKKSLAEGLDTETLDGMKNVEI
ncbi:Cell wall assembly regulator [Arachnomyces sp. PD_36]|nr:Cell wall assembly regulator [Arachnomyces sp. PD_36]